MSCPMRLPHRFWVRLRRSLSIALAVVLSCGGFLGIAHAHEFHPGVLALTETQPGTYLVHFSPPTQPGGRVSTLQPVFPEHCNELPGWILECGPLGLTGTLSFRAEDEGLSAGEVGGDSVSLVVHWAGGSTTTRMVSWAEPTTLHGTTEDAPLADRAVVFSDYFLLGTEHMLSGWDHLLFVLGLVLLAPYDRKLVGAVTAFTLAHSMTLALSVLGAVRLDQAPVELSIALSIVFLASEAARNHDSLTHRYPWLVAFAMGLLHGLGFAGVLEEVGVPPHHAGLSLVAFNLGVENGQLAFLTVLGALIWMLARRDGLLIRLRWLSLYATGTAAVFWTLERMWGMVA